jgi:hypothetical protein
MSVIFIHTHTKENTYFFFGSRLILFFISENDLFGIKKKKGLWELIFEGLVFDESQTGMCTLTPWLIAALTQGVFFFILNKKEKLNLFFFKVIYFTQINTPLYFAEEKCLWIVIIITSHTHTHRLWAWIKKSSVIFKVFFSWVWMGIKESSLCYVLCCGQALAKCALWQFKLIRFAPTLIDSHPVPKKDRNGWKTSSCGSVLVISSTCNNTKLSSTKLTSYPFRQKYIIKQH